MGIRFNDEVLANTDKFDKDEFNKNKIEKNEVKNHTIIDLMTLAFVKWSTYYQTRLNREDAQRERKKSRDTSRDDTLGLWRSKKLRFRRNPGDVFNRLNSMS